MTHILVKDGRVVVQGGRVLTSQDGAPCCCDGGTACDIETALQIHFNQLDFTLETTREAVIPPSGSAPELRSFTRTTWDISFPPDTLIRYGRQIGINTPPVIDIREEDVGIDRLAKRLRADCSGYDTGSFDFDDWFRPSLFTFYPTGTITKYRREETWNLFGGFRVDEYVDTIDVLGLYAAYVRTTTRRQGDVVDASIYSIVFAFVGCLTQTRNGEAFVENRGVRTEYVEMLFEDSEPAQLAQFGPQPLRWQDIPIRSTLGDGCGPFEWSESNLSGRRYINDGDAAQTERQVLFSFNQDYPEYFNSGSNDYAVIPRPNVFSDTNGIVTTWDHSATLAASGTIEVHDYADDPNGSAGCGDPFSYDCDNRPPVDDGGGGGGGGNTGGPTQGPGGTDVGGPSSDNDNRSLDPAIQAEIARQAQMRTGQFPGRCPSCGG